MTPFQKHRAKWGKCEECPLHEHRLNVCHLRGSIPCDVLFVGEAPGASEDVVGYPFAGPAGHKLDEIVNAALRNQGLRTAFTNLVGCLPTDESGSKNGEPPDESVRKCSPRLQEIIAMCKPRLIVWVGKLAAKHGRPKYQGISSVEIVHPAAILRADESQKGLAIQRATVTLADAFEDL